jgi:hypothetical protein
MWILIGIIIYFLVATPIAIFVGKRLKEVSRYYPPIHDREPRE